MTREFDDWKEADVAVKDNSFERNMHLYYQNRADSRTGSRMTGTDRNQFVISRGIMNQRSGSSLAREEGSDALRRVEQYLE